MIKRYRKNGIEEGKKIEYLSILFRPIENKDIWENCAKIIVSKPKKQISKYYYNELCWLENSKWPGYNVILNHLKKVPTADISGMYGVCIHKAEKDNNEEWINNLMDLLENNDLYGLLTKKEQEIINKYYNKRK